jgi:exodeoxyribonuclease VII small subunit
MSADKTPNLSFEDALAELEQIVKNLEAGKTNLDDMVVAYERGTLLKNHCETKLREAQMKIEQISLAPDGTPQRTEFKN